MDNEQTMWREALKDRVCSRTDFPSNLQNKHTPWNLCKEMIGKFSPGSFGEGKTFLTINLEYVEVLCYDFGVKRENIWFVTDCQQKANASKHPFLSGVNVIVTDYLNWNPNMKFEFDRSIINPPFNNNIDLQFIKKTIELTKPNGEGEIIVVHPAISSISRKPTKRFVDHKKLLNGYIKGIKIFNGNPVFKIGLFYPCQIVHITPGVTHKSFPVEYASEGNSNTYTFNTSYEITKWGNIPEYYSLERKVLKYCERDNCDDKLGGNEGCYKNRSVTGRYYINISRIRGNVCKETMFKSDFYTIVTKGLQISPSIQKSMWLASNDQLEAENLIKYLKTDFARFCLSIFKVNSDIDRGELKAVPYFSSYKDEWTKERITKELDITDIEWKFIEKIIPPYYK